MTAITPPRAGNVAYFVIHKVPDTYEFSDNRAVATICDWQRTGLRLTSPRSPGRCFANISPKRWSSAPGN